MSKPSFFINRSYCSPGKILSLFFVCSLILCLVVTLPVAASDALEQEGRGRTIWSDMRDVFGRVPAVYADQFFSRDGLRILAYGAPVLGLSTIEERDVSDFFRANRIPKGTALDVGLDHASARFFPLVGLPVYTLARAIHDDRLADLAVDLMTFSAAFLPEMFVIRFIGDRPRPDGSKDFSFGLEACSSFPSGHVAIAVRTARLLHYHYGPWVGLPVYLLAAGIAYQRLGDGEHYLADVVGGAILSYSLADAVVRQRKKQRNSASPTQAVTILPLIDNARGGLGLSIHWSF